MKKGIYKSMLLATLTMAGFTAVVTPPNTIEAKSVLKKTFKVGKTATYRGLSLKVNSFQYVEPGEYDSIDEGKHFIVANVTITNKSRKSYDYNPYDFKLNVNGNNTDFDASPDAVESLLDSGTLDKGASVTGNLAAEIKQGATDPKLKMGVNVFDDSKYITFSLK
ncbi:DUF4352 domain-containing protein [Ligilactobacillus salivarius]|uniref:DUF4352 domain-containing protein n=1 Tax=Ligilactobacillus salivarius TaxID=1624 RepID=UPI00136CE055|nr:DUF4352 domain-containing protein [Ligilactobacillus salivarius]MYZ03926.1 DUF4352 domain-containing protein [Ligilactobacillus salivarius]MYZ71778.1 DUF4352 domain-containing protein [Ligilactobacillus salivarius]MYZ77309.1 DUF4352 domain-containing protein [Ligilactobacillus salivarius]